MFVSYTFEVEEKTKEKIEKLAREQGRSLASQIRIVLDEFADGLKA